MSDFTTRWPASPDISTHIMLGRLDAKADQVIAESKHHTRVLEALVRSNDQALIALQRSTQHLSPTSGNQAQPPSVPSSTASSGEKSDEGMLLMIAKHFFPKALLWAAGRALTLLFQWLLPTVLLAWAITSKWIGTLWSLVLAWLGLGP